MKEIITRGNYKFSIHQPNSDKKWKAFEIPNPPLGIIDMALSPIFACPRAISI
jgi:hypothetical protein